MEAIREAFRQLIEGQDFDSPAKLLGPISSVQACTKLEGWPYSIATNVAHADHWQAIWLCRLTGKRGPQTFPDFPVIAGGDWPQVREKFLQHLDEAAAMAAAEPFHHNMKSDEIARKLLLQIVIHDTYHVGQVKLLKRLMRAAQTLP